MRISQAGSEHFAASLLPYSSLMLEEATHQNELPPVRHTFLRLLAAQMGVGGDDSWGAPVHEQYQLPADRFFIAQREFLYRAGTKLSRTTRVVEMKVWWCSVRRLEMASASIVIAVSASSF